MPSCRRQQSVDWQSILNVNLVVVAAADTPSNAAAGNKLVSEPNPSEFGHEVFEKQAGLRKASKRCSVPRDVELAMFLHGQIPELLEELVSQSPHHHASIVGVTA